MTFPIMTRWSDKRPEKRTSVPLAMIAPHDQQARLNHGGQTLTRLAERGGLSACEAVAVLEDRRWSKMDDAVAEARLDELVAAWTPTQ